MRGRSVRGAAASGLVAVAVLLGACSEDVGERLAERVAEEQLGGDADVEVDSDTGDVQIHDGEGNSYVGGQGLPDDFPDEVPLLDGEMLSGASVKTGGDAGWTVSLQVDGDVQTAVAGAVRLLEDAGFDLLSPVQAGVPGAQFDNGTWTVLIAVYGEPSAGSVTVSYTVGSSGG